MEKNCSAWCKCWKTLNLPIKEQAKAREAIGNGLTLLAPSFTKNKYILGDDFSMIDVALSPLLWRLDYYDIKLGKTAAPLLKYAERYFSA